MSSIYSKLYRGFINNMDANSKAPASKYKGVTLSNDIEEFDSKYPAFNGALAKGVIMLDFDDKMHMRCFDDILRGLKIKVPTLITDRGRHYYFKCDDDEIAAS